MWWGWIGFCHPLVVFLVCTALAVPMAIRMAGFIAPFLPQQLAGAILLIAAVLGISLIVLGAFMRMPLHNWKVAVAEADEFWEKHFMLILLSVKRARETRSGKELARVIRFLRDAEEKMQLVSILQNEEVKFRSEADAAFEAASEICESY